MNSILGVMRMPTESLRRIWGQARRYIPHKWMRREEKVCGKWNPSNVSKNSKVYRLQVEDSGVGEEMGQEDVVYEPIVR